MAAYANSLIESRRQAIQSDIDVGKSAAERNRLGQFATPNALAIDIARYVESVLGRTKGSIRFADPSIGSGSFFSAALAVFGSKRISSAVGIELDPAFADAARNLWADAGLEVVRGDFTQVVATGSRPPAPNLILANPPYVRHHHMNQEDKERLQGLTFKVTGVKVSGLAGLYVYFLLLATAWMEDGGIAAWLIPSEFMDVNYGATLKGFLADRVTLIRAHRFDPDADGNGYPLLDRQLCVIDCNLPEPMVEAKHPALWGYLQTAQSLGIMDGYLIGKRSPWYRQEQREPTPFLCTYLFG